MTPRLPCRLTELVLAHVLDGEPLSLGSAQHAEGDLTEHVRRCAHCRVALRRSRRLDAALAAAAGGATSMLAGAGGHEVADAWLARAAAAATAAPEPQRTPPGPGRVLRPSRHALRLGRLAASMAACVVGWLVLSGSWGSGPLASASTGHATTPMRRVTTMPAGVRMETTDTDTALAGLRRLVLDRSAPTANRIAAGRSLLATVAAVPHAHRLSPAIETLAALDDRDGPDGVVARALLPVAAAQEATRNGLRRQLARIDAAGARGEDAPLPRSVAAAATLAARLGAHELDTALLLALGRRPDLAETVSAALRSDLRPHGTANLLLAAWAELDARGLRHGDDASAPFWFGGHAASVFVEVTAELHRTPDERQRRRCLLALGQAPDSAATELLARWARGPRHDEAILAAFVLATRPRGELEAIAPAAEADGSHLLRAALARAAVPDLPTWIDLPRWTPTERVEFTSGPLAAFERFVLRFRSRSGRGD